MPFSAATIAESLFRLFINTPNTQLRDEDRKKSVELAGLLPVIDRVLPRSPNRRPLVVDAAAGKGYVGALIAALISRVRAQSLDLVAIERNADRLAQLTTALAPLAATVTLTTRAGELDDESLWPHSPDLVVALHACGAASDATITHAARTQAKQILIAPCCVAASLPAAALAARIAERLGVPDHAELRRGLVETVVAADRTLLLEALGYDVQIAPFVPPTVTPYNRLWQARRVGEPNAMARAAEQRRRLWHDGQLP